MEDTLQTCSFKKVDVKKLLEGAQLKIYIRAMCARTKRSISNGFSTRSLNNNNNNNNKKHSTK